MKAPNISSPPSFDVLLLDLGDVMFEWDRTNLAMKLPSSALREVLGSAAWYDFECGLLPEGSCYAILATKLGVRQEDIADTFIAARASMRASSRMFDLIKSLREQYPSLKVFGMSNISTPDWESLCCRHTDWAIFDEVFTSANAKSRKPDQGFYKFVMREAQCIPQRTILVDDKVENVLTARSLGFEGIVYDDFSRVARLLRNKLGDPVQRGKAYLNSMAGCLTSVTNTGVVVRENFAQLLILELTGRRDLVFLPPSSRTYKFFEDKGILTSVDFPNDLDTTSLALTILHPSDKHLANSVISEMKDYCNRDGILQVYFDHDRPRLDPIVTINALSLFYMHGRGHEARPTLNWIYQVLLNRAYVDGTRYYSSGEAFLYFLDRLISIPSFDDSRDIPWLSLLASRIAERVGLEGNPLSLAMRILLCKKHGLAFHADSQRLLDLQSLEGCWEEGWFYKYGSSGIQLANSGLTTAMAIAAIETPQSNTQGTKDTGTYADVSTMMGPITTSAWWYRWWRLWTRIVEGGLLGDMAIKVE